MSLLKLSIVSILATVAFTAVAQAATATATAKGEQTAEILWECGDGYISSIPCDERMSSGEPEVAGYDRTYRCSNGWQVTHPDYCPDSGKNNIWLRSMLPRITA